MHLQIKAAEKTALVKLFLYTSFLFFPQKAAYFFFTDFDFLHGIDWSLLFLS